MTMNRKITFEDCGQDFLWWVIDENGLVIDCGPFQASVWVGSVVDLDTLEEWEPVCFDSKSGEYLCLNYVVESIEEINYGNEE